MFLPLTVTSLLPSLLLALAILGPPTLSITSFTWSSCSRDTLIPSMSLLAASAQAFCKSSGVPFIPSSGLKMGSLASCFDKVTASREANLQYLQTFRAA